MRNVAVNEPRKIAVFGTPGILKEAEHQIKGTGKWTSVLSNFSMWGIFVH